MALDLDSTICAVATPGGKGGIAVIRVSGKYAFEITERLLSGKTIRERKSHTLFLAEISDKEGLIDEGVVSIYKTPNSYTGEDVVEMSVHASKYIQERILNALLKNGARIATAGEYTMRAFLNGRMDLVQSEAVADLIASENKAGHLLALNQLKGGVSSKIELLKRQLTDLAALVELELDFSEEDVEFADRKELMRILFDLRSEAKNLRDSFYAGNAIKEGVPIAIIGKPNAGKSTLLNVLLNEERALVSEVPGTTRDAIEDVMVIEGIKYRFIDTAGLRETSDLVESAGIERTYEKMRKARLWLYVFEEKDVERADGINVGTSAHVSVPACAYIEAQKEIEALKLHVFGREQMANENDVLDGVGGELGQPKVIYVKNKCDKTQLMGDGEESAVEVQGRESVVGVVDEALGEFVGEVACAKSDLVCISAKYKTGLDRLQKMLLKMSGVEVGLNGREVILSNVRHYEILGHLLNDIEAVERGLQGGVSGDLMAIDIRRALSNLGEITGEISADDILGTIFGRFCIGK